MTSIEQFSEDRIPELRNIPVYTADGEQIGHVGDVYYDEEGGRVEAVGIAGDALGFSKRVVPVQGATIDDRGLQLPYARGDVEGSPEYEGDDFDEQAYGRVREHYGRSEASVVRSEEELAVGKQATEAGRVRLRKWVETEPVELDVALQRETARVEREPINQPVSDVELGEDEVEVPLHAEQPVVMKETVAKERVGLAKDVETEHETVSDEVRKERVDVDEDAR